MYILLEIKNTIYSWTAIQTGIGQAFYALGQFFSKVNKTSVAKQLRVPYWWRGKGIEQLTVVV